MAAGAPVVVVTVYDATAAAASFDYLLPVDAGLGIFQGHQDVGPTAGLGTSSYSDPTYTVSGGMGDIGGSSDKFQFLYLPMTGNGRLTARVASQTDTDAGAQAGVMFFRCGRTLRVSFGKRFSSAATTSNLSRFSHCDANCCIA